MQNGWQIREISQVGRTIKRGKLLLFALLSDADPDQFYVTDLAPDQFYVTDLDPDQFYVTDLAPEQFYPYKT